LHFLFAFEKENRCAMATSGKKNVFRLQKKSEFGSGSLLASTQKCTDLGLSLLYILMLGTYSKFARKHNFLALGVCFPQPCSSAARLAAGPSLPHQDHVHKTTDKSIRFHNQKFGEMRCKLDSTENPRSFEKYPTPP